MSTEAKGQRVNINGKATDVLFKDAAARNTLNQLTYPGHDQAIMGTDSYVCDVGQKFAPTLVSNTSLKLADGEGVLQGVRFRIPYGSTVTLTIAAGTSGYKRIDLVVARYSKSAGEINFVVIKGTNATSSPATPAYNTGNVIAGTETVDFPLYKITLDGTTVSSVDKLFTQLQTMKEMQDAISKLNTDIIDYTFILNSGTLYWKNYYSYKKDLPDSLKNKTILSSHIIGAVNASVILSVIVQSTYIFVATSESVQHGELTMRFVIKS